MSDKRVPTVLVGALIAILLLGSGYMGVRQAGWLGQPAFTLAYLSRIQWADGESADLLLGRRVIAVIFCGQSHDVPPRWIAGPIITDRQKVQRILDIMHQAKREPIVDMCSYSSSVKFVFDDYTGVTFPFAIHAWKTSRPSYRDYPEPMIHGHTWYSREIYEELYGPVPTVTPFP